MRLDITKREKNPLLHREEIYFQVTESKITPSRKEVRAKIAALVNAKEELVIIDKIESEFGKKEFKGYVKVYESKEFRDQVDLPYLSKRIKEEEKSAEPVSEASKEKPKEEVKAEEKKEEKAE